MSRLFFAAVLVVFCGCSVARAQSQQDEAAFALASVIKAQRTYVCQRADAVLSCHFDYREALDIIDHVQALASNQLGASSSESINLQNKIDADFERLNELLARLRQKYQR